MDQLATKKKNINLTDRPFDLNPSLKYFYISRPHKRAIVYMRAGLQQPDGVLILTSEKGMGKTSLIAHVLDQLDKNNNIVAFIQKPPQTDRDFLPAILTALQIPITENQPKELFKTLHKFMLEQVKLNKKVLLVIDDAENLSHNCLEVIRLLTTLRLNEHGLLQTVLVGTNELDEMLSADENQSFRQQISMSYCMQPLQISDTREYIEHRLKVTGWNGDPVIDEDAFGAIHQLTGGVPYAINRYCDRLIMPGLSPKSQQVNNNDVSNLTSAIIEKLEKFEAVQPDREKPSKSSKPFVERPSPPRSGPQKEMPVQQAVRGLDVEEVIFNTPIKKSKSFLSMQTLITIAAALLISSISVIGYNKMSGNSIMIPFLTASHTQPETKGHSVVKEGSVSHESSSETNKYVLEELPEESSNESQSGNAAKKMRLLDIQELLSISPITDSNKNLTSKTMSNASGNLFDAAPEVTFQLKSELNSRDSHGLASIVE